MFPLCSNVHPTLGDAEATSGGDLLSSMSACPTDFQKIRRLQSVAESKGLTTAIAQKGERSKDMCDEWKERIAI